MIPSPLIPLLWLALVGLEVWYNWYLIERLHRRINHRWHTAYRVAIGFVFWISSPVLSHHMVLEQWWTLLAVMPTMFWAVFDFALNWSRGRYITYLGGEATMDQLQKKYGGETLWFVIRWVLMIGVLIRYFTF